jgi:hypothetical protein
MSSGSSLGFPGGRTLAAWWRHLSGWHPEAIWIGYLTLHRLEALVCALRPHTLPPFETLVLKAMALHRGADAGALGKFLHLAPSLVGQVQRHLQQDGLLQSAGRDLTDAGWQALQQGNYLRPCRQRRAFYFWHAAWHQPPPSRFVALAHADQQPWLASPDVPCAVEPLCACVERSAEWKRAHGFPLEVREVGTSASWEHVVLAAPQRLFAAVIRTAGTLVALAVQTRTWELQTNQPAWIVPDEDWMQAAPDSAWRQTFVEWCRQRQIGSEEAAACGLTWRADRLLVQGPDAVEERLRAAKGEAWVLAGDGPVRAAARLEPLAA